MRIVVTGGAGFIGSHIADALLDAGHEVLVVDDLSTGRRENVPVGARFVEHDIRDADGLRRIFADFRPEMISHQAAQTSVSVSTREPTRDADVNVLGTIAVLRAAVDVGVRRVVFASTGGAFYGEVAEGRRADLDTPLRPLSPYACSKLAGEHYVRLFAHDHDLDAVTLRYANVYGPRQDPHGEAGVVAIFSRRLIAGEPIRMNAMRRVGDDGCVRDYVMVRDVVKANLAALEGRLPSVLNVCTGVGSTTAQIARGLAEALGVEPIIEHGPRRPGDLERSVLDPGDAIDLLGAPTPLDAGLVETAQWFRAQPG